MGCGRTGKTARFSLTKEAVLLLTFTSPRFFASSLSAELVTSYNVSISLHEHGKLSYYYYAEKMSIKVNESNARLLKIYWRASQSH